MIIEGKGTAKSLKFVMEAKDAKHKKYVSGQNCANCKFYVTKKEFEKWAPCKMLANKYVPACGWCKSYIVQKKKA